MVKFGETLIKYGLGRYTEFQCKQCVIETVFHILSNPRLVQKLRLRLNEVEYPFITHNGNYFFFYNFEPEGVDRS